MLDRLEDESLQNTVGLEGDETVRHWEENQKDFTLKHALRMPSILTPFQ